MATKKDTVFKLTNQNAFKRSLSPSIGYMGALNEAGEYRPVEVTTASLKGTISNYLKDTKEVEKKAKDINNGNLQTIDIALLPQGHDRLVIEFSLLVEAASLQAHMVNNDVVRHEQERFMALMVEKGGYRALAQRYLQNIINLRWMWANRLGIDPRVTITEKGNNDLSFSTDVDFDLNTDYCQLPGYAALLDRMVEALTTKGAHAIFNVRGEVTLESGQQVKPSQELVLDEKQKGNKSRILYSVATKEAGRHAALHPQKIGNALRTIDTWYADFDVRGETLPIEPYGVLAKDSKAYRIPSSKTDFYSLADKLPEMSDRIEALDSAADDTEALYVLAVYIRGGVFSV